METNTRPARDDHHAQAVSTAEELERLARILTAVRNRRHEPWDNIAEELEEQLQQQPLSVERIITYRVTLGTGGPAHGVDFTADGDARAWYQDWFTEKTYVAVDEATADTLAMYWGVAQYDEGVNDESAWR